MITFAEQGYELTAEHRARLVAADQVLGRLRAKRESRVAAADCSGLATWAFDSYLQLGLYRIVSLADGIAAEWNAFRVVNCAILTRSMMETAAAWWHLLDRAVALLQKEDIRGAHSLAMKAMFGMRLEQQGKPSFPKSTSVVTQVDRLEKTFPGVKHFYEALCEVLHPNCEAMWLFGYMNPGRRELLLDGHQAAKEPAAVEKILFGFLMFEVAEKCLDVYLEKIRPQIVALERRFGTHPTSWPGKSDPER